MSAEVRARYAAPATPHGPCDDGRASPRRASPTRWYCRSATIHRPPHSPHHVLTRPRPQPRTYVHPTTQQPVPLLPDGPFPHVHAVAPTTAVPAPGAGLPWWADPAYVLGAVSARPRRLRVVNTATGHVHVVEAGCEETVGDIVAGFAARFNANAASYEWRALVGGASVLLDPGRTLEAQGVPDDGGELAAAGLDPDDPDLMQTLTLRFKDSC